MCSFYKQTMAEMKNQLVWEEPGHNVNLFQRFLLLLYYILLYIIDILYTAEYIIKQVPSTEETEFT